MANRTLYVRDEDDHIIERAKKLSDFYDGQSLSRAFVEMCEKIVKKYEPTDEVTK